MYSCCEHVVVFGLLCKTDMFGLCCCFHLGSVSPGSFGRWDFYQGLIMELGLGWAARADCGGFSGAVDGRF